METARAAVAKAGFQDRVTVELWSDPTKLPLPDNTANLLYFERDVVATKPPPDEEILRILVPGKGKAIINYNRRPRTLHKPAK